MLAVIAGINVILHCGRLQVLGCGCALKGRGVEGGQGLQRVGRCGQPARYSSSWYLVRLGLQSILEARVTSQPPCVSLSLCGSDRFYRRPSAALHGAAHFPVAADLPVGLLFGRQPASELACLCDTSPGDAMLSKGNAICKLIGELGEDTR